MRRVFADTLYWVAITHRKDQWHAAAQKLSRQLAGCHLVTTDEILIEYLTAFCEAGQFFRRRAAAFVRSLHVDPAVTVLPQTRQSFLAGIALYEARPDKQYSLTDCIAMEAMRQEGLTEVLTHDQHFAQEGFVCLL